MKIAIASKDKTVSEHFGYCDGFAIFDTQNGLVKDREFVKNPGHKPGFLPVFLSEKGVKVIISGGMGSNAINIFNGKDIEVIVGVKGDVDRAIKDYLEGKLEPAGNICHGH